MAMSFGGPAKNLGGKGKPHILPLKKRVKIGGKQMIAAIQSSGSQGNERTASLENRWEGKIERLKKKT